MTTTERSAETTDRLVRAFSSPRRRLVLSRLCRRDGRLPIEELARGIERVEGGHAAAGEPASTVSIDLWHVHLPLLSSAGLVTVDREQGTVGLGSDVVTVESSLDRFSELLCALEELG